MAVHTKHPATAPPAPPVHAKSGHLLLRGWCVFVLVSTLSGTAWVLAFGDTVAAAVGIGSGIVSLALWLRIRPVVQWRRLPWFLVAFVIWAVASLTWSAWPAVTVLTLLLLTITTIQGLFVAAVLTWNELVRKVASALKWVLSLSLLFELWVAVLVRVPVLPGFIPREEPVNPLLYWSRNNLFDLPWSDNRLQGIMGNANLLGPVALIAMIVFAVLYAHRDTRRITLIGWFALAAYLFVRAASATAFLAAAGVLVVLATILLMRTAHGPGSRTKYYAMYVVLGVGGGAAAWLLRDRLFVAVGRGSDLTGREAIWDVVLQRAAEHPVRGWGFATPWIVSDPAFAGWILDHDISVQQAHNVWVDVYFQLGAIGVVLLAIMYLAFFWRSWFFAVDRPRWDLRADRPYSALSVLPGLVGTVLLVQGVAESNPLLLWGWMFLAMFSFKIKQSPFIGAGLAEQGTAIEYDLPPRLIVPGKRAS